MVGENARIVLFFKLSYQLFNPVAFPILLLALQKV